LKEVRVWGGESKNLELGLTADLYVTIPHRHYDNLKAEMVLTEDLTAPITKGKSYGTVTISLAGETIATRPLVALKDVAAGNFMQRFYDKLMRKWEQ
jgi:serine-type D-Ala-D-Ala carboxypeptidase (penicillin-binding protein 5/6)